MANIVGGLNINLFQNTIFKAARARDFFGEFDEDVNYASTYFTRYKDIILETPRVLVNTPKVGGCQKGGSEFLMQSASIYELNMFAVICRPDAIHIQNKGNLNRRGNNLYPKIISYKYKK